ncbi:helix-turn-helix domain-containing protein [Paenibacillus eucommiae]|uniref:AraC-like DNA-binding protein n=1 Tax=Paenibacillus eucommiae TaxID=1355755 RepID=A0ABS4J2T7_9BACL|nr:hypothetical protein [Paenibacillus eucommiae]MBP1994137.1 AraC-like DNA-binding protein [Paenibacillus eucommiae]
MLEPDYSGTNIRYIEQNYSLGELSLDKPKLTLIYMAEQLGLSPYMISKHIHIDLQDFINRKRIDHVIKLLAEPAYSVSQIAVILGFSLNLLGLRA